MKRAVALFLILTLALSLCACGEKDKAEEPAAGQAEEAVLSVDPETGEWTGQGGCYRLEPETQIPSDGAIFQVFLWGGELSYLYQPVIDRVELCRGGQTVFSSENMLLGAAVDGDSVWVCEDSYANGQHEYDFIQVSPEGEELNRRRLRDIYSEDTFPWTFSFSGGELLLQTLDSQLLILSGNWEPVRACSLPADGGLIRAGDGLLYVTARTAEGNELYSIDSGSGELTELFSCPQGTLCSGGEGYFLLLLCDDGLYAVDETGGTSPIVLWAECSLSGGDLGGVRPMPDGSFLCQTLIGYQRLKETEPAQIHAKTRLTMAKLTNIGPDLEVTAFNAASPDHYIEVLDYSEGGALDWQEAQMKLNTELIAGKGPDLIKFYGFEPSLYIAKGLLLDMTELLESDGEIGLEDIAVPQIFTRSGGIYTMGNSFNISTILVKRSDFGDRYGWTTQEYLDIDRSRGDRETLYNMTREGFLSGIVCPYAEKAVDWQNARCELDTPDFITLLKAAAAVRETPEDPNNMDFTPGPVRVAEGSLVGDSLFITSVTDLADAEAQAGCELSPVGEPTADGSCGSTLTLNAEIGIRAGGSHIEGCWDFIKFHLKNADTFHLPVYRPALEDRLAEARQSGKLSDKQAEEFMDFLQAIESTGRIDQTLRDIITEECQALFAGDRTAEETARLIQSRASLYVAEQS